MSDNNENEDGVDSVLNIGNRNSKLTFHGSRSRVSLSRTASAYIKAQVEVAALMVLQNLLQRKHALEKQEHELRRRKEQLELEGDIAATMAKMKVLAASKKSSVPSSSTTGSDGKQSYFGNGIKEKKTLHINTDPFVPQPQVIYTSAPIIPEHSVANLKTSTITTKDRADTEIITSTITLESQPHPVESTFATMKAGKIKYDIETNMDRKEPAMASLHTSGLTGAGEEDCRLSESAMGASRTSVVKVDMLWKHQFKMHYPEGGRDIQRLSRENQRFRDPVLKSAKQFEGPITLDWKRTRKKDLYLGFR